LLFARSSFVLPNVQAFIRRAPRTADRTSWTKSRVRMSYGNSIVAAGEQLEAGTVGLDTVRRQLLVDELPSLQPRERRLFFWLLANGPLQRCQC
jgi:hypothetical protein